MRKPRYRMTIVPWNTTPSKITEWTLPNWGMSYYSELLKDEAHPGVLSSAIINLDR